MGNCLVLQENVIMVMKTDGKVLEYKAPMQVQQLLSEFSGHAISDSFPDFRHLQPDAKLLVGHLYYLVPLQLPSPEVKKEKVKFSNPEVEDRKGTGVVRIKLVVSKQQLEKMLQNGGALSVDDLVSQLQSKKSIHRVNKFDNHGDCKGWKPVLDSIPEVN